MSSKSWRTSHGSSKSRFCRIDVASSVSGCSPGARVLGARHDRAIVAGSRAIPHLGQVPGPGRRTSGCIGQVYSPDAPDAGVGSFGAPTYFTGSASKLRKAIPAAKVIGLARVSGCSFRGHVHPANGIFSAGCCRRLRSSVCMRRHSLFLPTTAGFQVAAEATLTDCRRGPYTVTAAPVSTGKSTNLGRR